MNSNPLYQQLYPAPRESLPMPELRRPNAPSVAPAATIELVRTLQRFECLQEFVLDLLCYYNSVNEEIVIFGSFVHFIVESLVSGLDFASPAAVKLYLNLGRQLPNNLDVILLRPVARLPGWQLIQSTQADFLGCPMDTLTFCRTSNPGRTVTLNVRYETTPFSTSPGSPCPHDFDVNSVLWSNLSGLFSTGACMTSLPELLKKITARETTFVGSYFNEEQRKTLQRRTVKMSFAGWKLSGQLPMSNETFVVKRDERWKFLDQRYTTLIRPSKQPVDAFFNPPANVAPIVQRSVRPSVSHMPSSLGPNINVSPRTPNLIDLSPVLPSAPVPVVPVLPSPPPLSSAPVVMAPRVISTAPVVSQSVIANSPKSNDSNDWNDGREEGEPEGEQVESDLPEGHPHPEIPSHRYEATFSSTYNPFAVSRLSYFSTPFMPSSH